MVSFDFTRFTKYPNKGDAMYLKFGDNEEGIFQVIQIVFFNEDQVFDGGGKFRLMYLVDRTKI